MTAAARYIWIGVCVGVILAALLPSEIIGLCLVMFMLTNPDLYRWPHP